MDDPKLEYEINLDNGIKRTAAQVAQLSERLKAAGVEIVVIKNGPFKGREYYKARNGQLVRKRR
jgi:hypothetical protein